MKLNLDCIKDILEYLEAKLGFEPDSTFPTHTTVNLSEVCCNEKLLSAYPKDEIIYACEKMREAKFITTNRYKKNDNTGSILTFSIDDITLLGHEFLKNSRTNGAWQKFKEKSKPLIDVGLDVATSILQDLAKGVFFSQ